MMKNNKRLGFWFATVLAVAMATTTWAQSPAPRTGLYNIVMQNNLAADYTTADYLVRPHLIEDLQYLAGYSGQAGLLDAAFAFQAMDLGWFGAVGNFPRSIAGTPVVTQRIRAGVQSGGIWGGGLLYELSKNKAEVDNGTTTTETKVTAIGDAYGVFGSFNIGFGSLYGEVSRSTGPLETNSTDVSGSPTVEQTSTTTDVTGGWILDAAGEGDNALGAQIHYGLSSSESSNMTPEVDQGTTELELSLSHGIPFVLEEDLAVFAGSNNTVNFANAEDKTADIKTNTTSVNLVPNIAFRKTLGKGFEINLGVAINLFHWSRTKIEAGVAETKVSNTDTYLANGGSLNTGVRWLRESFAFEANFNTGFFANGPHLLSGTPTNPMFGGAGLTLGF